MAAFAAASIRGDDNNPPIGVKQFDRPVQRDQSGGIKSVVVAEQNGREVDRGFLDGRRRCLGSVRL